MKKIIIENWRSILMTTAGMAVVFGISFLIFSSQQDGPPIPDPDPQVIEKDILKPNRPDRDIGSGRLRPDGPLIISPATITIENASVGLELPPITVQNQSTQPRRVIFDFAPFYRTDNEGVPIILSDKGGQAEGRKYMKIEPQGARTIGPGESLQAQATVVGRTAKPTLTGSLGVTLIGERGDPSDPQKQGVRTQIRQDVRLSALIYAVFPGGKSDNLDLINIKAQSGEDGAQMYGVVEMLSRGDIPSVARGEIIVSKANGPVLARQEVAEKTVLPGQRSSTFAVFSGLPPGQYRLEGRIRYGRQSQGQSISREFAIGRNGLPTVPEAKGIISLSRAKSKPKRPLELKLQLRNTGEKSFKPRVDVAVFPYNSDQPIDKFKIPFAALGPSDFAEEQVTISAPERPGAYAYNLTVRSESKELLYQGVASLQVGAEEDPEIPLVDRFRDWLSDNPGGAVALGVICVGVLLFTVVGIIAIIQRARRRRGYNRGDE
jgi:hypothetical protein